MWTMDDAIPADAVEVAFARVLAGDREAYAHVVEAYEGTLRTGIAAFCPRAIDPREIVHQAFIVAFRQLDRYRVGSSPLAWLRGIARNLLLAELRRLRRERARRADPLELAELTAAEEELAAGGDGEDDRLVALRRCLAKLPADASDLLQRHYARGESLAAIAEALGKSMAAVKFRLHWLRRKLHACMTGAGEEAA